MAVADVRGIVQQILPVGADVEHHRDDAGRVDAAGRRVNRQLADGDLDSAHAPVADSQNLFGVGGDDQVDIAGAGAESGKCLLDGLGMVDGEVHAARAPALMVVLLHRHAHGEVVDDRDHFPQVFGEQPVEEHLVAVVQGGEVDILAQRVGQPLVLDIGALDLGVQGADIGREQAGQAQSASVLPP